MLILVKKSPRFIIKNVFTFSPNFQFFKFEPADFLENWLVVLQPLTTIRDEQLAVLIY
jgi:hypothetical protein